MDPQHRKNPPVRTLRKAWPALAALAIGVFAATAVASDAPASTPAVRTAASGRAGDWPMWGGRPDRNMVAVQAGLPAEWYLAQKKNLKWVANLGSQTFGNPVISGGKLFIGTNNEGQRNPAVEGDRGVLLCLAEADGAFLWQAVHDKLEPPEAHDWPDIGISSGPCAVGDRLYYVSNRGELVCADTEGFLDGENDGPLEDEKLNGRQDADFVWMLDMVGELGALPHHASSSSPLVVEDLVFVVTGNGIDENNEKVPAPQAPSFIAVNRLTGKLVWKDASPGANILDGQWSAPAYAVVKGQPQVVFPGGDGWLYAFEPKTGRPIWKFNCNSHLTGPKADDPKAKNYLVGTPVCLDDRVYVAIGQAPDNGDGPGCLWAIDATKTGDITSTGAVWKYQNADFRRSVSTVAVHGGLLYLSELRGFLHCLEASSGKHLWRHDVKAPVWASPLVADGKVYLPNEDGDVAVFAAGREAKLLATNATRETVYATPVTANGTLYIVDRSHLYAIADPAAGGGKAPASAPAGRGSAEWPSFRGNPQLTGVAAADLQGDLQVRWKFQVKEGVESTAAIAGGIVYVGGNDGILYALDAAKGTPVWKYEAGAPIRSSPGVHEGAVFFGDSDGIFHAVDARGGTKRWTFTAEGEIVSSANFAGQRVLFGSYDGHLYCLNAGDGKLMWKFETEGNVHGTPGLAGDKVLVAGCDERLRVVRLEDGTEAAKVNMEAYSGASAATKESDVFVGTFGNQVLGIDWTNARVTWTYDDPEEDFAFYSSAAVGDDTIVIGGRDKRVYAFEPSTGKKKWVFETRGRVDASPVISGRRVFVGSYDGVLYALNLADGKPSWRFEAGSAIVASPAVADCLVISNEEGTIFCLAPGQAAG